MSYDLAIIGAGPGGYVAALRASRSGKKVALIEKDSIGGTCLNRGCIPTKIFVASAGKEEWGDILKKKDAKVANLRSGILTLLKNAKVELISGEAKFVSKNELNVSGRSIKATEFIIAVGSQWRELPGLVPDGEKILSSDQMLGLKELPKKLLIVGGGVIGCEFASIMHAMGVKVAIVELMDRILPLENPFISRMLSLSFKKRGIEIYTSAQFEAIAPKVNADKVLVSIGRKPSTEILEIEIAGIEEKNGYILTDSFLRTNVQNIYAIGDCAMPKNGEAKPLLAHTASYEGLAVVEKREANYSTIPRPIFTLPEIACVGAAKPPEDARTGRFSYAACSKAVCDGRTEGAIEIYVSENDKISGACIIGAHATDICAEITLAMQCNLTAHDVINTMHAHPTYSEMIVEALQDAYGMAVHKSSKVKGER